MKPGRFQIDRARAILRALGEVDDLSLRYRAAEPVLKTCRADARVIARGEALIVQLYAEVERKNVCGHLPRISGCAQELSVEALIRFSWAIFARKYPLTRRRSVPTTDSAT